MGSSFGADTLVALGQAAADALNKYGWQNSTAQAAVKAWQQMHGGLTVDGKYGPASAAALAQDLGAGKAPGAYTTGASHPPSTNGGEFANLLTFATKYGQTITQGSGVAPGFQSTRTSVVNSFVDWSKAFEGYLPYMYTDAKGLVTTGMGNLIDPIGMALGLPWKSGGSPASQAQIQAEWQKVKSAYPGVQSTGDAAITSLRLDKDGIVQLVTGKLKQNDAYISSNLPGFADAPADAQLAVHSMAWAMGPGFVKSWTQFRNAFINGDYAAAAAQSHMQGVGIDMRNLANKLLLTNADIVKKKGLNPDHLYYVDGLTDLAQGQILAFQRTPMGQKLLKVGIFAAIGSGLAGLGYAVWQILAGKK